MLRKRTRKLQLRTETVRLLTRLQATRVQGAKTPDTADPCISTDPTVVQCDATDGCQ
jgi:hypothetical protein